MTRAAIIGSILTVATAGGLAFLVIFVDEFYSTVALFTFIAFQLSFIWTCAELLDSAGDDSSDNVDPPDRNFSR